jgi:coenzyme F420-0:L-glutamate ligase/coenzyme F420-1:gamma-L-glutamate ligase
VNASESSACRVTGLSGIPEVEPGDDLVRLTVDAVRRLRVTVAPGDVFIYTQKIVSKAGGSLVHLDDVAPTPMAREWGQKWGRDPRVIELVLRNAVRIVRMERGVLITETSHGFICANGGIDTSNVAPGWAALLPPDPDASARGLCGGLRAALHVPVAVVISDTFGRPWREGQTNVAIGVAGLRPIVDYRGGVDTHGQALRSTAIAIADELAAAGELVMGKTRGIPVAIVQGTGLGAADLDAGSARDLLRRPEEDMFR